MGRIWRSWPVSLDRATPGRRTRPVLVRLPRIHVVVEAEGHTLLRVGEFGRQWRQRAARVNGIRRRLVERGDRRRARDVEAGDGPASGDHEVLAGVSCDPL